MRRRSTLASLTIAATLSLAGCFSGPLPVDSDSEATTASPSAKPQPTSAASEEDMRDRFFESEGWAVAEHGETYVRFATAEDYAASGGSCGYYDCLDVILFSQSGCPTGFYVRADILAGGTPVDWTNGFSPSALAGETVVLRLEDVGGMGDSFRLSEVTCNR